MTMNRRERRELQQLACELWEDDPCLARKLEGKPAPTEPSQTRIGVLAMLAIAFGLGVAMLGVRFHDPPCVAFGIAFATGMPILTSFWFSEHWV